jgi:cytochrome P450
MVMSLPLALMLSVLHDEVSIRIEASKRGAVLPIRVRDPYPGGVVGLINGLKQLKKGYPADGLEELCEKLGSYTFNRRVLFENRIITCDPEHIKTILTTQFDDFERGPEIRHLMHPLLGTGVFAADGELWKFHRSMTRPFFNRDRISHFDNFDRHAEDVLRQLKNRLHEGHPVNFQVHIFRPVQNDWQN